MKGRKGEEKKAVAKHNDQHSCWWGVALYTTVSGGDSLTAAAAVLLRPAAGSWLDWKSFLFPLLFAHTCFR